MMKRWVVSLLPGAVALALLAAGCGRGATRPNVVLIVVDTLRADAVACGGDPTGTAPAMDRLASEGVCFERAVAPASWNLPSVSSLVTSAPPWVHGQGAPATGTADIVTLAETFGAAGYRTGAFTEAAWPLLQRGFETFQNTAFGHTYGDPGSNSAARTLKAALDWARQGDPKPFFLLIHSYEAHSYFLGKPRHHERARAEHPDYRGPFRDWAIRDLSQPAGPQVMAALLEADDEDLAYVRSLYRAAVAEADREIGRFVTGLEDGGLGDDTIVALTSSNGEGFRPDLNRVHHGGRLHHDVLHVPLIVRWTGRLEPGVSATLASTLDVAPTLTRLAGLDTPPAFEGRPLVVPETGLLSSLHATRFRAPTLPPRKLLAQEAAFRVAASGERAPATGPQYALYLDWVTFIEAGDTVELYDLKADPEQEHDRAAEHPRGVKGLRQQVRQMAQSAGPDATAPDAQQLEQLRSLGYVQ